jgi:hypothetical protein
MKLFVSEESSRLSPPSVTAFHVQKYLRSSDEKASTAMFNSVRNSCHLNCRQILRFARNDTDGGVEMIPCVPAIMNFVRRDLTLHLFESVKAQTLVVG